MTPDPTGAHCTGVGCRHGADHEPRFAPGSVAALARRDARRGRHETVRPPSGEGAPAGRHGAPEVSRAAGSDLEA